MAEGANKTEQKMYDKVPDELVERVQAGEPMHVVVKDLKKRKREEATPKSPQELLLMLGCDEKSVHSERKLALLALAAKQPSMIRKLDKTWVNWLKDDLSWPLNLEVNMVVKAAEKIREHKFFRLPQEPDEKPVDVAQNDKT